MKSAVAVLPLVRFYDHPRIVVFVDVVVAAAAPSVAVAAKAVAAASSASATSEAEAKPPRSTQAAALPLTGRLVER